MNKEIDSNLLRQIVTMRRSLDCTDGVRIPHEGGGHPAVPRDWDQAHAQIVSIFLDRDRTPQYTLRNLANGELKEFYAHSFCLGE